MRSKVTFILLALNLILFGYLVIAERPWIPRTELDQNRHRVLGPEAANLRAIEISAYADQSSVPGRTITLKRDAKGDSWLVATPSDWPANDFAVRPILTALEFLEDETSFPVSDLERNGQTLADYGLAHPRLVVTATPAPSASSGGVAPAPFVLRVGGGAAIGPRLYVLSPDGRRIHVVNRALFDALDLDLDRLRSDQLFTIPVFEARALTIKGYDASAPRTTRLRRDQTRWLFEAPITARAAKTPVELVINDLNSLRVASFLPSASALSDEQTGLSAPRLRITLEGNARRETLLLGLPVKPVDDKAETEERYARLDDRPSLFTVRIATGPEGMFKKLETAQTGLRDPRILDFDPALVTSITLAPPAGTPIDPLRIQKLEATAAAPSAWQLAAPSLAAPLRADPELVARLLRNLHLLAARSPRPEVSPFYSDAPSKPELENLGFNSPERTISLQLASPPAAPGAPAAPPTTLVLELGLPGRADPGLYARVQGQTFVYSVPPETLYLFDLSPRSWRDRSLARLPEATRIARLVVRRADAPDAAPLLDYTPSATPPSPAVATLLAAVRDLRAKRIEREDYPATVPVNGVEKPWAYTLEATLDPATEGPFVLSLSERAGGMTQQAGSARLGLVFTLEQPVLDALWSLLYPPEKPTPQ